MSMSAPSVQTYDPYQTAAQQQNYNTQSGTASQMMSEVGQNTPFGTLNYQQTGSYVDPTTGQTVPLTTATTQLSPAEASLFGTGLGTQQEAATGAQGLINQFASTPTPSVQNAPGQSAIGNLMAGANYGGTPTGMGDFGNPNVGMGGVANPQGFNLSNIQGGQSAVGSSPTVQNAGAAANTATTGAMGLAGQYNYMQTPSLWNTPAANWGTQGISGVLSGQYAPGSNPQATGATGIQSGAAGGVNTALGQFGQNEAPTAYGATRGMQGAADTANTLMGNYGPNTLTAAVPTANLATNQAYNTLAGGNYGASTPNLMDLSSGLTSQVMSQEVQQLQPFFNNQTTQLDTQLRNQGLTPETPAYQQAMMNLSQNQNQSVSGFLAQTIPQAVGIAQQQYQLPLTTAQQLGQFGAQEAMTPEQLATGAVGGIYSPMQAAQTTAYQAPVTAAGGLMGSVYSPAFGAQQSAYQLPETIAAGLQGGVVSPAATTAQNYYSLPASTAQQLQQVSASAYPEAVTGYQLPETTAAQILSGITAPEYSMQTAGYQLPLTTGTTMYQMGAPASLTSNLINTPTATISPANLTSAVSTAQQAQNYQAQLAEQQYGSTMGGIGQIGSAAIMGAMLSDVRAKDDVRRVGTLFDDTPVYSFRYKDDPLQSTQVGLMAQEVEARHPEAVKTARPGGYKYVDYKKATAPSSRIAEVARALAA